MFSYDADTKIASITADPLNFDINDLVETIQIALDNALEECSDGCIGCMDTDDYRKLCNLVFERAKYV